MKRQDNLANYVTFCPQTDRIMDRGLEAELRTVEYLYKKLLVRNVGPYRILVNYNLPQRGSSSLEIDLVVINHFGIFLIEVKGWLGKIEGHYDDWIVRGNIKRKNPVISVNSKARALREQFFEKNGPFNKMKKLCVTGLFVLTEGLHEFNNFSNLGEKAIVSLDEQLLHALSSTDLLFRGSDSRTLSDEEINTVYEEIYGRHQSKRDELIDNYRILKKLQRVGDLAFEEYEAQNVNVETQHVRVKRYLFREFTGSLPEIVEIEHHFKRNIEVLWALGYNPCILNTITFFPDAKRPDVYFEVTELPTGERLDAMMEKVVKTLTLDEQLRYLMPLCEALRRAHNYITPDGTESPVFHRNVSLETVFLMQDSSVKLADFDFAKFGPHTINPRYSRNPNTREQVFINKPYTASEVLDNPSAASAASDIYALGVLWYFLACPPQRHSAFNTSDAENQINTLPLPEAAQSLMKRMVAAQAVHRPQKIEEVISELQQLRQQD